MWERKELKAKAKIALKANYWKSVLVGVLLAFFTGSMSASASQEASDAGIDELLTGMSPGILLTVFGLVLAGMILSFLIKILVYNPLTVSCQKFFVECEGKKPPLGTLGWCFKNGYGHIGIVMFFKTLFIGLWSILFVIPGIIKSYEYRMVPYILADNPSLSRKEVFAKSKEMMNGNKWNAFVLDLSFIGWLFVAGITGCIAGIFYVFPYIYHTDAQLYLALKNS